MQQTFAEIFEASGGRVLGRPIRGGAKAITAGGSVNHEMDVTRMSARAEDGGVFVRSPFKTPTLTIMALAWRACERLLEASKKGELN
jgi:hypothetical protein